MNVSLNRRRFFATAAATAALGSLSTVVPSLARRAVAAQPITLIAGRRTLEVSGKAASVFTITQPDGTSGLVTDISSPFLVNLRNDAGEPTLIHWHGLTPPSHQDGVPGLSGPLLAVGASADYDFPLAFPGTFWMHSHEGLQEQQLMAAPLIVRESQSAVDQQEVVVMLHDFSFRSPDEIFAGLRKASSSMRGMNMGRMSGMKSPMDHSGMAGVDQTMPGVSHGMPAMEPAPMTGMPMGQHGNSGITGMAMDLNDVEFDAFLANDRTLGDPDVVRVEPGGHVLLRIINGSAASNYVVDLNQLKAELVAVDGHPVQSVTGSMFPIAIAQRLDLSVSLPFGQGAYPVLAILEGENRRTGIVLATSKARVFKVRDRTTHKIGPLGLKLEQALRAVAPLLVRPADRVHKVDLTGAMEGYVWGLNGRVYGEDKPLMVARGERIEIVMTNRTMMSHPMHLHGHFFQVVAVNKSRFSGAVRDTVLVPPMTSVTIAFDADNPGKWAFHCHNLYHMHAGMMTSVQYMNV